MKTIYATILILLFTGFTCTTAFALPNPVFRNSVINPGQTVTANNVSIEGVGKLEVNGTLIINGDLELDLFFLLNRNALTVNNGGKVIVKGNLNNINGNINLNGGSLTVEGNYSTEDNVAEVDNLFEFLIFILSGSPFNTGNNTSVNADNNANFEVQGTTTLVGNASLSSNGNSSINLQDDVLLSDPGTQLSASGSSTITVGGNVDGSGTLNTSGSGSINVEGAIGVDVIREGNGISLTDFIVNSGSVRSILGNFIYGNIIIEENGTLNIPTDGNLLVLGNLTNNGTIVPNGGTVRFLGLTDQTLAGSAITRVSNVEVLGRLTLQNTLEVNKSIAITGTLESNGNLKLLSNATGTAVLEVADQAELIGDIIMQRYLPGGKYGHYISSSLKGVAINTVTGKTAYGWNANSQRWFRANGANNFRSGMGYNISINQETVLEFTGEAEMDPVTVMLTDINESDSVKGGFNLIGNPYPNAIRWDERVLSNTSLVEGPLTAYVYNGSETRYETLMAGDTIEAGQAFFVKALQNNVELTFTPDMMVTESPAVNATRQFYRQAPTKQLEQISLNIAKADTLTSNLQSRVRFVLDEAASLEYLPEEDAKYMAGFANTTEINALVGDEKVAINVIPAPEETDTLYIPLQVKLIEDGEYSLTLTGEHSVAFKLHDKSTGETHDLGKGYTFSGVKGETNNRFSLVVNHNTVPAKEDTLSVQDTVVVQDTVPTKNEITWASFNELSEAERKNLIIAELGEEAYQEYLMLTADTLQRADTTALSVVDTAGVPADTLATDESTADTVAQETDTLHGVEIELPADTLATADSVQTEQPTDSLVTADSVETTVTDTVAVAEAVTDTVTTTTRPDTASNEVVAADTVQANVISANQSSEGSAPAKENQEQNREEENVNTRKPGQSLGLFNPEKIRTAGFNGVIRIWFPKPLELNTRVVVFTLNGQMVTEQTVGNTDYSEVPVNKPGLYIIQLFNENSMVKRRVLVK